MNPRDGVRADGTQFATVSVRIYVPPPLGRMYLSKFSM